MQKFSYTLNYPDGKPFLRQYAYHVSSFHYNWHKEIELICVLRGNVEVCAGKGFYELEEDDMLLINANVGHATLSRAVDSVILLIRVDPSFFKKIYPDFEHHRIRLYSKESDASPASFALLRKHMAQMMLAKLSDAPISAFAFDGALYMLAWILLRDFPPMEQEAAVYSDKENENNVHSMIHYLEEHFREKLTLHDMAKQWNYSSTYASQLFKEHVGINFYDYLTRLRLRHAIRDLSNTQNRILDIAAENGFQDLKSFNTKFREIFGRTPSDYRRSLAEEHIRYNENSKMEFSQEDYARILDKLRTYTAENGTNAQSSPPVSVIAKPKDSRLMKQAKQLERMAENLKKIAGQLSDES